MEITIAHLYPELLNLYGDRGNITTLSKRLNWRGIDAKVLEYKLTDDIDLSKLDIVFIGGGSDREQRLVCNRLCELRQSFEEYAGNNGVIVAICGGYQLLGKYYSLKDETIEGLGILDLYTEAGNSRLISNVIIKTEFLDRPVVGFENHGGRTYIGSHKPLGSVMYGNGNNGSDKTEGVIENNIIGTYLHGPLLPKNPHLCDYILSKAIERKYGEAALAPLDDSAELKASEYIIHRFLK